METINNKNFSHRPISELFAIVKHELSDLDDKGMIDEGRLIKTIMYCNDRLGVNIREIKQACVPVAEYKAKLPLNFEKLYYAAAITATNTMIHNFTNPYNNKFDRDILYEADLDRDSLGCTDCYNITIKRKENITVHNVSNFISLDVSKRSLPNCHLDCPNNRRKGKYTIDIVDDEIHTPFRSGELYIMYLGTMQDEEGNLMFPFHPMITPYYEWMLIEKVLMTAILNSDTSYGDRLALAQRERGKAWLDAYDMTTSKGFGEYVTMQKKKELGWYNQWFKYFK